jgi:hypothetical protein
MARDGVPRFTDGFTPVAPSNNGTRAKSPKCEGEHYAKRTLTTSVGTFDICSCGMCRRGDDDWTTVPAYTRPPVRKT